MPALAGCQAFAGLALAVGDAARRGLLAGQALGPLTDLAVLDSAFAGLVEQARAELSRSRTLKLPRAGGVAERLWAPTGPIGALLTAVAEDRRDNAEAVGADLRRLHDRDTVAKVVDLADDTVRGPGSRRIQGQVRNKLVALALDSLRCVAAWVDLVRQSQRDLAGRAWLPSPLLDLRQTVHRLAEQAHGDLQHLARDDDPEIAGAATLATHTVTDTVHLLDGQGLAGNEPDPNAVLGRCLLRAHGVVLGPDLRPQNTPTLDQLLGAAQVDWITAVRERIAAEDFQAARLARDALAENDAAGASALTAELDAAELACSQQLVARRTEFTEAVQQASRQGQLTEDQTTELANVLSDADPGMRTDLYAVRAALDSVAAALPSYLEQARKRARDKLARLVTSSAVSVEGEHRIAELVKSGDFATADEFIAILERGSELPSVSPSGDLNQFFPTVPQALPNGIDTAVLDAVASGATAAGVSFADLSEEARRTTTQALTDWATAGRQTERYQHQWRKVLGGALRIAGLEASGERDPAGPAARARSRERRWVELTGIRRTGRSLVPEFGSAAGDAMRLLLVWGQPEVKTVLDWAAQDGTDRPVIVCYFGTLSAQRRRILAVASQRTSKPIIVLDDAALIFLAAHGAGRFSSAMRILLPFSGVNPYDPQAEGNVPIEMFYGRAEERASVMAADGTSLIYGGRQLGKSALLHAVERDFVETGAGVAVYLTCPPGIGAAHSPDALWSTIESRLAEHDIRPPAAARRTRDASTRVEATVNAWLEAHPDQRLLLLVDECDLFFDADAKLDFLHTRRLRDLRNHTGQRFKPVLAGLHQVARFAGLPNQPFAHLGKPAPIGPLAPDPATRLVADPLEALGIEFDPPELIGRVLAYCNRQPILIQLFGQELVRRIHARRDDLDGPPWTVTSDELEDLWKSPRLQEQVAAKIRLTLDLDPRYRVVACLLGLRALDHPTAPSLPIVELRQECASWWPAAFSTTAADEFRSLLEEMEALGMLTRDTQGRWRLRSENVRRMLGSRSDIEDVLVRAEDQVPPGSLTAAEARPLLGTGTRHLSPLSERQLAGLIRERNQLRLVLGSAATAVGYVGEALAAMEEQLGRYQLIRCTRIGGFRDALRGGQPNDRHRVIFSDLSAVHPENRISSMDLGHEHLPDAPGVTRSVVLVADNRTLDWWYDLLDPDSPNLNPEELVELRRLDDPAIAMWDLEQRKLFGDSDRRRELLDLTGGWPVLVDRAGQLAAEGRSGPQVLAALRKELADELGKQFVQATGIPNSSIAELYDHLAQYGEALQRERPEDVIALAAPAHSRPAAAIAVLVALQALVVEDDATLTLEPALLHAWTAHS